jgi:hypothetical protein
LLLPNGITGFSNHSPKVTLTDVKRDCYAAIQSVGGKIEEIIGVKYPKNFYEIVFSFRKKRLHALFNYQYPMVAFASNVAYFQIEYMDDWDLSNFFQMYDYQVLSVNELNTPLAIKKKGSKIRLENENDLSDFELEQIQYWEAKTIGEVIFNYWD